MPDGWIQVGTGNWTLDRLPQAAQLLLREGSKFAVWLLEGEMGSGKTTLAKSLVKEGGVESLVTSPTFSIVNEYGGPGKSTIYHFDFYRIKNETEALDFGFEEYLTSGKLCLIEWSEKVKGLLPDQFFEIKIKYVDSVSRELYFRKHDRKEKNRI